MVVVVRRRERREELWTRRQHASPQMYIYSYPGEPQGSGGGGLSHRPLLPSRRPVRPRGKKKPETDQSQRCSEACAGRSRPVCAAEGLERRAVRAMQSSWASSSAQNHFRTALTLSQWSVLRTSPGTMANWARRAEEG